MPNTKLKKGISGTIQLLIGSVLFSPAINHPERIREEFVGLAMVGIGSVLIVIGFLKIIKALRISRNSSVYAEQSENMSVENASSIQESFDALVAIGGLLVKLSYVVVGLTIAGTLYMVVFIGSGGASGVPILFGIMLAGIIYTLGKSCK